jgi:CrcB protein
MGRVLLVALGGAVGSAARYLLSTVVQQVGPAMFPSGTFAVNVLGCLVVGFAVGLYDRSVVTPDTRLFLVAGVCGGFTTFSAFGLETMNLVSANQFGLAALNACGQLAGGLVAVWGGLALAKLV